MDLLKGKTILLTGASRGIGYSLAKKLIDEGANVIALARTLSKLEDLDDYARSKNSSITIIQANLEELEKLDNLGPILAHKFSAIDAFIANAAMLGGLSPITHTCTKTWNKVMDVNLNANFRILKSIEPLLKNSGSAKVIFMTSKVAESLPAYWSAYAISKAALEAMSSIYAKEVKINNISVYNLDPGMVDTKMLEEAMPGLDMANITKPDEIAELFLKILLEKDIQDSGEMIRFCEC